MQPGRNLCYVHSNWAVPPLGNIERRLRKSAEATPSVRIAF